MKIRLYNSNDKYAWDEYVLRHPDGFAYHLIAWKDAIEMAYQFQGSYLIAVYSDGNKGKIAGILPLIFHTIPFMGGQLISLPFCDAAGPLTDSEDVEKALLKAAEQIAHQKGIKKISIRKNKTIVGINPENSLNKNKVRMLLDLPRSSDTLLASFHSKLRSQIKKPMRDGLHAKMGSTDLLDQFYPLFAENMRDLGSPVHSMKWFATILKSFGNRAHLVLVCMPDHTPAAGGIIICHPNQVSVPWASSLRRFNRWNPNMLLYWTFLKFASDMGYPLFDFGRSTPQEGTYRFKKQWGAKQSPLHWFAWQVGIPWNREQKPSASTGNMRRILESITQKIPISASIFIGSRTRKYIPL